MISIHALRKECDQDWQVSIIQLEKFLSTHSVRSATANYGAQAQAALIFLSTHSVRSATV